ncbi:hypothetical protein LOTGIDRAFT_238302 [Lottia gigantea]|uniref:N-acetyltransferase domain-containing protein n=1 Tax=Lottia gigantea TaxID=225164 RepID=V4AV40_LOTGI|nr:hypothetical protein LOTGIDRAFT_238302 [Lottia gigantea]ESP01173.1 hypothetical protein LOTGIDRAFT_238302 [Lottia gigantea]
MCYWIIERKMSLQVLSKLIQKSNISQCRWQHYSRTCISIITESNGPSRYHQRTGTFCSTQHGASRSIHIGGNLDPVPTPVITSWKSFSSFSEKSFLMTDETVSDLRRFLNEVGTDPKEARFWLKHFATVEEQQAFAVFQIDPELFCHPQQLEILSSSLSFLHRNKMKPVIVCGPRIKHGTTLSQDDFQKLKTKTALDMTVFTSLLESHGVQARPLFVGSGVIKAKALEGTKYSGEIMDIDSDIVQWCLLTQHIPVISSLGETTDGQILSLDLWSVTRQLSQILKPLKVMKINLNGGFVNNIDQVVANVNLPVDLESNDKKSWLNKDILHKTQDIYELLCKLPSESSVVITSVNNLLKELFTHRGSGTFFKITEPIQRYRTLDGMDMDRFTALFNKSFKKNLKPEYFEEIEDKIDRIYLSKSYNAGAVILRDEETNIPYLCKLGVSAKAQGEGTSELLWDTIRQDYQQLFWRSRIDNFINSWYFKKCEGSWTNSKWTVFWYGVTDPSISTVLINTAMNKEPSFQTPSDSKASA